MAIKKMSIKDSSATGGYIEQSIGSDGQNIDIWVNKTSKDIDTTFAPGWQEADEIVKLPSILNDLKNKALAILDVSSLPLTAKDIIYRLPYDQNDFIEYTLKEEGQTLQDLSKLFKSQGFNIIASTVSGYDALDCTPKTCAVKIENNGNVINVSKFLVSIQTDLELNNIIVCRITGTLNGESYDNTVTITDQNVFVYSYCPLYKFYLGNAAMNSYEKIVDNDLFSITIYNIEDSIDKVEQNLTNAVNEIEQDIDDKIEAAIGLALTTPY